MVHAAEFHSQATRLDGIWFKRSNPGIRTGAFPSRLSVYMEKLPPSWLKTAGPGKLREDMTVAAHRYNSLAAVSATIATRNFQS